MNTGSRGKGWLKQHPNCPIVLFVLKTYRSAFLPSRSFFGEGGGWRVGEGFKEKGAIPILTHVRVKKKIECLARDTAETRAARVRDALAAVVPLAVATKLRAAHRLRLTAAYLRQSYQVACKSGYNNRFA